MTNPIRWWQDWWRGLGVAERTVVILIFVATITIIFITQAAAQVAAPDTSINAVYIALIAMIPVVLVTPLINYMNERSRRRDRAEDLAERNVVAERQMLAASRAEAAAKEAALAARTVEAKAEETASLLKETNKEAVKATVESKDRDIVIHGLVNSGFTASKQAELDSKREILALHLHVAELNKALGKGTAPELMKLADEEIGAIKSKIVELEAAIAERTKQANMIDKAQGDKLLSQLTKET